MSPTGKAAAGGPAGPSVPVKDKILPKEESDSEDENQVTPEELEGLRTQVSEQVKASRHQAQTLKQIIEALTILTEQATTPVVRQTPRPRMKAPEKYEGDRSELRSFLTNIDLYCTYNEVPTEQEKILTASMHMKGKAANWMQPYVDDYLQDIERLGTKTDTQVIFTSWESFKREMGRIFGEVDEEHQAERAITRLRQTKSVSAYTAEFKQLQAKIDWDDAALRTVYEKGLKDSVKDALIHHERPDDLQTIIELATRIDNRIWERSQQKRDKDIPVANTKRHRNQVRYDQHGDVIMTGQVKDKKSKPRRDGLSKEERQRRFDRRACLLCGEDGHFKDKCPNNKEVKIRMINTYSHLLRKQPSEEDVSDLDLYEQVRTEFPDELLSPAVKVYNRERPKSRLALEGCQCCEPKNGHEYTSQCEREDWHQDLTPEECHLNQCVVHEESARNRTRIEGGGRLAWCAEHDQAEILTTLQKECNHEGGIRGSTRYESQRSLSHAGLHWTACFQDDCLVHLSSKEGSGYYPKRPVKGQNKKKRSKN